MRLQDHPEKLERSSCLIAREYWLMTELAPKEIFLRLKWNPCLLDWGPFSWSRSLIEAVKIHVQFLGLVQMALQDLDKTLMLHGLQVSHVLLVGESGELLYASESVNYHFGKRVNREIQSVLPEGGVLTDALYVYEIAQFDRIKVVCERREMA